MEILVFQLQPLGEAVGAAGSHYFYYTGRGPSGRLANSS